MRPAEILILKNNYTRCSDQLCSSLMYFMALKKSNSVLMLWFVHVLKTVHIKQFKGIHSPKFGMREDSGGASALSTPPPPPPGLNLSPDNFHHRKH